jgi:hypothetical protein
LPEEGLIPEYKEHIIEMGYMGSVVAVPIIFAQYMGLEYD